MSMFLWLVVGATVVAAASELVKRANQKKIYDLSDEAFVKAYKRQFSGVNERVIAERRHIANVLGLDSSKLRPDHRFSELSKLTGFLTEYEVGISDLEAELLELLDQAGLERPSEFPVTVGELISKLLTAKDRLLEQESRR